METIQLTLRPETINKLKSACRSKDVGEFLEWYFAFHGIPSRRSYLSFQQMPDKGLQGLSFHHKREARLADKERRLSRKEKRQALTELRRCGALAAQINAKAQELLKSYETED